MTGARLCLACQSPDEAIFHIRNQWCRPCTRRWYRAGRPEAGPPALRSRYARIEAWRRVPDSPVSREVSNLGIGIAAEHLVCADLLLQGYRAFMTDQTCPYDVAVDIGSLIRVQVKSTREARLRCATTITAAYWFSTARPYGRRVYDDDAFDLLALVALDIRVIAYIPLAFRTKSSICIHAPGSGQGKQFADFPFAKAVADLGLV